MARANASTLQLAAVLDLSPASLEERLRILGIDPEVRARLAAAAGGLVPERAQILDRFYDRLRQNEATRPLLGDDATLARLKAQQAGYLRARLDLAQVRAPARDSPLM